VYQPGLITGSRVEESVMVTGVIHVGPRAECHSVHRYIGSRHVWTIQIQVAAGGKSGSSGAPSTCIWRNVADHSPIVALPGLIRHNVSKAVKGIEND
jgi:hypothetical protein